ncbi:MAG: DUF1285 domain-containing protein [Gammaproteobacteria bacterium]|nr:DUF1285 domain-containing protein [Gammaproteobacteria bacterium]
MNSLADIEAQISAANLPPVQDWHPAHHGRMDLVIRRDGSWWHEGSPIQRESLVRLFSTILRREPDGSYCLVTPVEKLTIEVELAPFLAVELDVFGTGTEQNLAFRTNVNDHVIASEAHPLSVSLDAREHPQPVVLVREHLTALLSRSVYYQVVDRGIEQEGHFGVWSAGTFHSLGSLDDD